MAKKIKGFRSDVTEDDAIAYINEDYILFRKGGEISGTLEAPLDMVMIGTYGLPDYLNLLKYDAHKKEIVLRLIEDLNKVIDDIINYPDNNFGEEPEYGKA